MGLSATARSAPLRTLWNSFRKKNAWAGQIKKPKANGSAAKQPAVQKPCEKMTEAIVMDGGNRGRIVKVCADPNCRVHHDDKPSLQQLQRDRAQEQKRIEQEKIAITARHRILAGILEGLLVPIKKADLLTVAQHALANVSYNPIPLLAKRHKLDIEKSNASLVEVLQKHISRYDEGALSPFTTSSLEVLKVYSLGLKAFAEKGPAAALPYHQRAIQLDPAFALGYDQLGLEYYSLNQVGRASKYLRKAFQLREHASECEKLAIAADYYLNVTGELDKAAQTYKEWVERYPRQDEPYSSLGVVYASQGQYEKATEITSQALRIAPSVGSYGNLASFALSLQRFDEVQRVTHEAQARKMDSFEFHSVLYALAFLRADSAAMAEQQQWFAGKPEENIALALASDTEAFGGHLAKTRELTKRAMEAAIRADSQESGAIWQANAAVQEAAYGNATRARQSATEALKLAPASKAVEAEAALALAMAGETARAESLAQDLNKRFPSDTQLQSLWLPAIQSQLALDRRNLAYVLKAPQAASPLELGQIVFVANVSCLYPVYVRGEGYLAAGQSSAAAAEFQKILDHSGIVWNCWTGALAHLGVARASALQARTSHGADADDSRIRALAAYKYFLTLWNDADPDIPIYKEAKAEYAKLQ